MIGKLSTNWRSQHGWEPSKAIERYGGVRQLTSASVYESKCRLGKKSGMKRGVWQSRGDHWLYTRLKSEGMPNYLESSLHNKLTLGLSFSSRLATQQFKEIENYSTRSQDHFS